MIYIEYDNLWKGFDAITETDLDAARYLDGEHEYCAIDDQLYALILGWA